ASLAEAAKVPAILGPRNIDVPSRRFIDWTGSNPERIQGVAAGYQDMGHTMIGFNTDAPVIPAEELFFQASMGVRYGFRWDELQSVRGLTIVPALAAGIADRVGSLEAGKDADILIIDGDPADPRRGIDAVLVDGVRVYDAERDGRRF
ncbi:MAG: amidohydrolase family protein, partial [Planctomycetota bacterium]|nr:amidohydrolase family protein [Planctomycetota bacterium]